MTSQDFELAAVYRRAKDSLIIARACRDHGNVKGERTYVRAALKDRRLASHMRRELRSQRP